MKNNSNSVEYFENQVSQSNFLIENKSVIGKDETRLFLTILSQIREDSEQKRVYKIFIKEFASYWGIPIDSAYQKVKEAAYALLDKRVFRESINPTTGKLRFLSAHYLAGVSYEQGSGFIEVEISDMIRPFLFNLGKENPYTQYMLENTVRLSSVTSIRVYELLKQYEKLKKRVFLVSEFKTILGLDGKYSNNAHLEKYVLIPAESDVNSHTDLCIGYKLIGRGQRATIEFTIKNRKEPEKKCKLKDSPTDIFIWENLWIKADDDNYVRLYSKTLNIVASTGISARYYLHFYLSYANDLAQTPQKPYWYVENLITHDYLGLLVDQTSTPS